MRKLYTILILLLCAVVSAQDVVFDNNGGSGDGFWATITNWDPEALPTSSQWADITANITLNSSQTIKQISLRGNSITGTGTLTFAGGGTKTLLASANPGNLHSFNVAVVVDGAGSSTFQINSAKTIEFLKYLTVTTSTILRGAHIDAAFNVNGLYGSAELQLSCNNITFNSDNSAFVGNIYVTPINSNTCNINANTDSSIPGSFLNTGSTFIANNSLGSLSLNNQNIMKGNIEVQNSSDFLLDVNANQGSIGTVSVGNGILTIDVDAGVSILTFENSSALTWGAGSIAITGFQEKTIKFGSDPSGLNEQQLAQITADGQSGLTLDAFGYLTNPNLSVYSKNAFEFNLYPNPSKDIIYINSAEPLSKIKVYDLLGKTVKEFTNNLETVDISSLNKGLYIFQLESSDNKISLKKVIKN